MAGARPDTWMPMFWGDYLKDTGHLSTLEHGAYLLLIGHYWSSGAPLPDDDAKLRRIAKVETAAQWKKIRPTVVSFFQVSRGAWRHRRIDRELTAATKRSADAKAKAERAAKARWGGHDGDVPETEHGASDEDAPSMDRTMLQAMPGAMLEDCPPQSQSSGETPTGFPPHDDQKSSPVAARGSLGGSAHDATPILTTLAGKLRAS